MSGEFSHARRCAHLRDRVAFSVAIEEASCEALADRAALLRKRGDEQAAREIEKLLRAHRVGLIRHRAVMGAHGIEV